MRITCCFLGLLILGLSACGKERAGNTSSSGVAVTGSESSSSGGFTSSGFESCQSGSRPMTGKRHLRFLTMDEYKSALQEVGLFNPEQNYSQNFATPRFRGRFPGYQDTDGGRDYNFFYYAALELAERHWGAIAKNCSIVERCQQRLLSLAERLFRRPLSEELTKQYKALITDFGTHEGFELGVQSILSSPHFFYVPALGDYNEALDVYELDAYELASVLSFMYTGSLPPQHLLNAAKDGKLTTSGQIAHQIDLLLQSPNAAQHIGGFAGHWLGTNFLYDDLRDENHSKGAQLDEPVRLSMAKEAEQWFRYIFYNDEQSLASFFYNDKTLVNDALFEHYSMREKGRSPSGVDPGWFLVESQERGGVLTTGAFLVSNAHSFDTSPIQRAVKLRNFFLCQYMAFPDNIPEMIAEQTQSADAYAADGQATTRQYYEHMTDTPVCGHCHVDSINPLFGMEDFDHYGLFRTESRGYGENGVDGLGINADGYLVGGERIDGSDRYAYSGAKDLGRVLSELPATQSCFVEKSFRFLTNSYLTPHSFYSDKYVNNPSQEREESFACVKEALGENFQQNGLKPDTVFKQIGTLDLIRYRD